MSNPMISVVMPVYNTKEDYLREAIESILNQTYRDFEFIILNDGSTNNDVKDVILSYKDKRIKYVENKTNLGLVETLNKGIALAIGTYIARMDSDDISLPERFEKQMIYFENNPEVSLVSANAVNFPCKSKMVQYPEHVDFLTILKGCWIVHPLVMFRKADFEKYDLKYDLNYAHAEDYELWSRATKYLKFANLKDILLKYRVHSESISNSKHKQQIRVTKKVRKNMFEFLAIDKCLQKELVFNFSNLEIIILLKLTQLKMIIKGVILRKKGSN